MVKTLFRFPVLPAKDSPFNIWFVINQETRDMIEVKTPRRRNLLQGAAVAAGAMTAPMIAKAQAGPISMRWQSTWPSKDIFHEYALDFAKKVNDMTGGDLKIDVLPAGSVVAAFRLLEAAAKGPPDGGHGVPG